MQLRFDRAFGVALMVAICPSPALAQESESWQADLDVGVSILPGSEANWSDFTLSIGRTGPEVATTAQVRRARRFAQSEYLISVRHDSGIGETLSVYGGAAVGTNNRFLPNWRLDAGVSQRISHTDTHSDAVSLGIAMAHYSGGVFITLTPGAVRYFAARNAFVGIDAIALSAPDAQWKFGVRGQAGVDLTNRLATRIWLGLAPETERGRTEIVRSAALGMILNGAKRRSFRLTLAGENRASGSDRVTISIGITQKL